MLLIIFFFVPSFLVSCSGANVRFSAARAMVGVRYNGEKVSEASPICVLLILLPIAMLVVWCLKNVLKDKIAAIVCLSCAGVDLIMWFIVRMGVAANAEDVLGTSKVLAGFVFNIIFVLLVIAANILVMINILPADKPLIGDNSGMQQPGMQQNVYQSAPQQNVYQSASTQEAPAEETVCANCGEVLAQGSRFCTKCGSKTE